MNLPQIEKYKIVNFFQTINFDSTRGGISLVTEKGIHSSSRLLVQAARTSDAGAYECVPDNAQSASVRVHVLTGMCYICIICFSITFLFFLYNLSHLNITILVDSDFI